ncbi:Alpha/Beta hydrolase protein [Truncatella angustata]|uniref:Alpha/Beta hydrolase protein n=1 Tax=Truncatella angustata TaxID=152316 RepID=A0A9P8ZXT5_9PEZI|nr:Alpha/Beta hydrolase protein [Truncatella angustata]KAH6653299.1 Alpha/Beta hydrolase protein [Truncatella angustata]
MASWLWPKEFGFLQYLRLKAIAILFRSLGFLSDPFRIRRQRQLVSPKVRQERVQIPSRDKGRFIAGDLYYPPGYTSSSPAPILIHWHGSGFVIQYLRLDALFCSRIAEEAGIVVLDADYRKAPEHPFPCAPQDAEDVLRWRVAVSGFSSGATLSLVAATVLRKKLSHVVNVPLVISVYPATDFTIPVEEKTVPNPVRTLPAPVLRFFRDAYVPNEAVRSNPAASPAFVDPADFPDTTAILAADGDTLWPEADALAEKLKDNGRNVVKHVFRGVAHGFDKRVAEGSLEWTRREELVGISVKLLKQAFRL